MLLLHLLPSQILLEVVVYDVSRLGCWGRSDLRRWRRRLGHRSRRRASSGWCGDGSGSSGSLSALFQLLHGSSLSSYLGLV
jgi:hypothetical protein